MMLYKGDNSTNIISFSDPFSFFFTSLFPLTICFCKTYVKIPKKIIFTNLLGFFIFCSGRIFGKRLHNITSGNDHFLFLLYLFYRCKILFFRRIGRIAKDRLAFLPILLRIREWLIKNPKSNIKIFIATELRCEKKPEDCKNTNYKMIMKTEHTLTLYFMQQKSNTAKGFWSKSGILVPEVVIYEFYLEIYISCTVSIIFVTKIILCQIVLTA